MDIENIADKLNPWLYNKLLALHLIDRRPPRMWFIAEVHPGNIHNVVDAFADLEIPYRREIHIPDTALAFIPFFGSVGILEKLPVGVIEAVHYNAPVQTLSPVGIRTSITDPLLGRVDMNPISRIKPTPFNVIHQLPIDLRIPFTPMVTGNSAALLSGISPFLPKITDPTIDRVEPTVVTNEMINIPDDNIVSDVRVGVLDTGAINANHALWGKSQHERSFTGEHAQDLQGHGAWVQTCAFGGRANTRFGLCRGVADVDGDNVYIGKVLSNLGFGCFSANTWVLTPRGYKYIQTLDVGDEVISLNTEKNEFEKDVVVNTFKRKLYDDEDMYRITSDEGHVIITTETHKFLTEDGWKKAMNLNVGDSLVEHPPTRDRYKKPQAYLGAATTEPKRGENNPQYKRVEENCIICETIFEIIPSHKGVIKTCSKECSKELRRKQALEIGNYKKMLEAPNWMKGKSVDDPKVKEAVDRLHKSHTSESRKHAGQRLKKWREENPRRAYRASVKGAIGFRKRAHRKTKGEGYLQWIMKEIGVETFEVEHPIMSDNKLVTIADVAIPKKKIALFADGSYWHSTPAQVDRDKGVNKKLREMGWKVLRYTNEKLINDSFDVMDDISNKIPEIVNPVDPIVTKVEKIYIKPSRRNKNVYDLETGNKNYVVSGIVVHNSTDMVLRGMEWMVQNRVRVVNMSLGGPQQGGIGDDPQVKVVEATADKVDWVIAAGNSGPEEWTIGSPGVAPSALTVAAFSVFGKVATFSSRGPSGEWYRDNPEKWSLAKSMYGDRVVKPDVGGVGGGPPTGGGIHDEIYSGTQGMSDGMGDLLIDGYTCMRGTSMSAPQVAGMLALLKERGILRMQGAVAEFKEVMRNSWEDDKDIAEGYGLVNWKYF